MAEFTLSMLTEVLYGSHLTLRNVFRKTKNPCHKRHGNKSRLCVQKRHRNDPHPSQTNFSWLLSTTSQAGLLAERSSFTAAFPNLHSVVYSGKLPYHSDEFVQDLHLFPFSPEQTFNCPSDTSNAFNFETYSV